MNALFTDAVEREKELALRREALRKELTVIDEELAILGKVKEFYSKGTSRTAKPQNSAQNSPVDARGDETTLTKIVFQAVAARKGKGDYNHFDLKQDIDRDHPGAEISVKFISNTLYKFRHRSPALVKLTKKGSGTMPNTYQTI